MNTRDLLTRICSQPTAPFRENWVAAELIQILEEEKIPYFQDAAGNLIAGAAKPIDLERGFGIGLMAHMDHPGFHVDGPEGKNPNRYLATFWGGAPFDGMIGEKVRIYSPHERDWSRTGTICAVGPANPKAEGRGITIDFDLAAGETLPAYTFGSFDLPGINIEGDQVFTRAADDLAGCAIALGAVIDQFRDRKAKQPHNPAPLFAIFTRGEEVGFIGCIALLEEGLIHKNNWMLSLEASRELPEAEFGKGPVLRTGDRACLFDVEFSAVSWLVAQQLEAETKSSERPFIYQRRLMSGGTCEATPLTLFGFPAAGVAVPLRNYHNIGADLNPASEIISLSDVEGARRFCVELAKRVPEPPKWRELKLEEIRRDYSLLKNQLQFKVAAH